MEYCITIKYTSGVGVCVKFTDELTRDAVFHTMQSMASENSGSWSNPNYYVDMRDVRVMFKHEFGVRK